VPKTPSPRAFAQALLHGAEGWRSVIRAARRAGLKDYLGFRPNLAALVGITVLLGIGERIGSRFVPKYLELLGAGAVVVGIYGSLENFMGALWSLPGGWLSDRFGVKRCLAFVNAAALAGFLIVVFVQATWAVLAAAVLFMGWSAFSLPAGLKLVADQLPRERRAMGMALQSLARRFPKAVGPLLGGVLIAWLGMSSGVRVAFALAALLALVSILVQRSMTTTPEPAVRAPDRDRPWGRGALNLPLRRLLLSDILVRFCAEIPGVFVVLWVMNVARESPLSFGVLTFVEMSVAMLLYIPVAHFSDRMERKPFVVATFVFFTLFPVILYFSRSLPWLFLAFVVRGFKECGEPTRKALMAELAGDADRGTVVGIYYTARDGIVTLAPLLGGLLWSQSPALTLWVAAAFGAAGTVYFALFGREAEAPA
jgi:MFS family permease